ncbi:MAG: TonB-dependent receptor [Pyrinomonadaceae bacterium]|nr:TonB-dependent receptor [Pyrinomonadaceae bacterium]
MKQFLTLLFTALSFYPIFSQSEKPIELRGEVLDSNKQPITKAAVEFSGDSGESVSCETNIRGMFSCQLKVVESFSVTIKADNFDILRQNFDNIQDYGGSFTFTLEPVTLRADVLVTANRTATLLGETPASIATISNENLKNAASPTIDDALRQSVGFSLFRRSNSRNANPTTQGTSLRGINASGASRSLVQFDGIPVNDPFGGWVVWSRVPGIAVERIEALRGGASSLYGSDSLGGTINVVPRGISNDEDLEVSAELYGGTQNTFSGSAFIGFKKEDWSAEVIASNFQTKGYKIIDKSVRGNVDDFANSRNTNLSAKVTRSFYDNARVHFKTSYFGEARNNGTPVQKNRTHFRQFVFGGDIDLGAFGIATPGSRFALNFFGGTQVFDQKFSAVAADRNSENLVRLQRVPSQNFGVSSQLSTVFRNQTLLFGFESNNVRGSSDEIGFFGGNATSTIGSGGRERTYGIYFQDFAKIGRKLVLVGSVRFDSWKNSRALSSSLRFSTNVFMTRIFPDRTESALSPSGSVLFRANDSVSIYLNASRSFRAPTLNELYRGFRVGSIITDPNENLVAEKANNFETGISYGRRNVYLRGNFYWTEVSDAISNVTVNTTPTLIFRQRQNAGKTRVRGLEVEAEAQIRGFNVSVGYLIADTEFADFPSNRSIEGLRIPQVPLHQFTFQTLYSGGNGWSFSLQGRAASEQFDNDLNTLSLEKYFQLDAFAAKRFKESWQVFIGFENVFNSRHSIGRTPVRTVSLPASVRVGLRFN